MRQDSSRPFHAVDRLAVRLGQDREIRLVRSFIEHCKDIHLKDLIVHEMDDARHMRVDGRQVLNFGSDSYLGLDRHPKVQEAMIDATRRWGLHNGASRIFYSVELCAEAERRLAEWLEVEDTLIYPSVTLANVGLIPGLAGKGDLLVVDRQAHDSVQQGARIALANGATKRELHPCRGDVLRDLLTREQANAPVLTVDGIYSMTGASPPLTELDETVRDFGGVLYVDDAHGTGVVGERGRGAAYETLGTLENVLMVGSLSKGFSCMGAFVTCTEALKPLLKMKSSTYIFGGPVPPPYLAAICAVCDILGSSEYDELMGRLGRNVRRLADGLRRLRFNVSGARSPILSVRIGDIEEALMAGKWLFDRGFYVQSVTYPAVPVNGGLLRIQVNANHATEAIDELLNAFSDMRSELVRIRSTASEAG